MTPGPSQRPRVRKAPPVPGRRSRELEGKRAAQRRRQYERAVKAGMLVHKPV